MALIIDNIDFNNGVDTTSFYRSNTGDKIVASVFIRSQIRITSINNTLSLDPILNQVTSPAVSWIEEGFRPNDNVLVYIRTSGGSVLQQYWTQIQSVNNLVADFTNVSFFYDFTAGEIMEFIVVDAPSSTQAVERDEVDVLLNHTINGNTGAPASLIDGETTRVRITGVAGSVIGVPIAGTTLGNQSGQMLIETSLTKVAPTDALFRYRLDLTFVNTGMFDDGTWFFTASCLKAFISMQWARFANETYARKIVTYNEDADTGYYDEPYNAGIGNSTLIQGASEISYCDTTSHVIVVDGPTTDLQIGSCYLPQDETYFKNKPESQLVLSMVIPSSDLAVGSYNSPLNPSGAGYQIEVDNITIVGSQTTIELRVIPNAQLEPFMDSKDAADRVFLLWVRCGTINHLAYSDNLICAPVPADPLVPVYTAEYLDHSQNVTSFVGLLDDKTFNTEDDIAFYGEILLDKGVTYDEFNVYIEARNSVTGDDFILRSFSFSFTGVQISNDGRYLLNEIIAVNSGLPSTSEKINAILNLKPSLDTPTQYGVAIYAPILLDWRYWLTQANANVDFYPNQNKNWQQYSAAADWNTEIRLELVSDGVSNNFTDEFNILDYDSEPNLISDIQLVVDATDQNVGIVTEGELMRVVATHELVSGTWGNDAWGMITVEPTEGAPRKIISTAIPFDFDPSNPFYPLDGVAMVVTYPAPNIAQMECYFNPDLINTQNGVKFTSKIKKSCIEEPEFKTTTLGAIKTTTTGENKTIAN